MSRERKKEGEVELRQAATNVAAAGAQMRASPLTQTWNPKPFPDPNSEIECARKGREMDRWLAGNEAMVPELGRAKGSWRPLSSLRRIQPSVIGVRLHNMSLVKKWLRLVEGMEPVNNNDSSKAQHELDLTRPNSIMLKLTLKSGLLAWNRGGWPPVP